MKGIRHLPRIYSNSKVRGFSSGWKNVGFLEDKMSSGPKEQIPVEGSAFQTLKLEQRI